MLAWRHSIKGKCCSCDAVLALTRSALSALFLLDTVVRFFPWAAFSRAQHAAARTRRSFHAPRRRQCQRPPCPSREESLARRKGTLVVGRDHNNNCIYLLFLWFCPRLIWHNHFCVRVCPRDTRRNDHPTLESDHLGHAIPNHPSTDSDLLRWCIPSHLRRTSLAHAM